jgi:integrase/recombinase XerC
VFDARTHEAVQAHMLLMQVADMSHGTIYSRCRALTRMQRYFGDLSLLDVDEHDLMQWRMDISNLTADTVVHYVAHARVFYAWATDYGWLQSDPSAKLPSAKLGRRLPRPIDEDGLDEAVLNAPERIRPWLALAGWAGFRCIEVAFLDRSCVLERAQPPVLMVSRGATKGRGERAVPMSPFVSGELVRAGLPAHGPVFTRRDGRAGCNQPWTVSELGNLYLHSIGIPESMHQLRHRFATQLYQETRDIRLVQEVMGHASPRTTAGYAAVSGVEAADAVARLRTPGSLRAVRGQ